ncbi:MAG: hypothetical protein IT376_08520 [Polyangiaceae bacterium]|nr:hypothetical protein [Polyangiaceae bacterium]
MSTARPVARLLALFLLAAPVSALAAPRGGADSAREAGRGAHARAAKDGRGGGRAAADRRARGAEGERDAAAVRERRERQLRAAGVDAPRIERALTVMERHDAERAPLRKDVRAHAQALRELLERDSGDDAAYRRELDGLKEGRAKLQDVARRQQAALAEILTPKEQAKLLARAHRDRGERGARRGGRGARRGADERAAHRDAR